MAEPGIKGISSVSESRPMRERAKSRRDIEMQAERIQRELLARPYEEARARSRTVASIQERYVNNIGRYAGGNGLDSYNTPVPASIYTQGTNRSSGKVTRIRVPGTKRERRGARVPGSRRNPQY